MRCSSRAVRHASFWSDLTRGPPLGFKSTCASSIKPSPRIVREDNGIEINIDSEKLHRSHGQIGITRREQGAWIGNRPGRAVSCLQEGFQYIFLYFLSERYSAP